MMQNDNKVMLLVEDNPDDELLMRRALSKYTHLNHVIVVHDGVEAVEYLAQLESPGSISEPLFPDLILLDLKMPRMDGHQALKYIRGNKAVSQIPVVILTTSCEEYDIAKSYDLGANSFLHKPVNFDEFLSVVELLTKYWLGLNVVPPRLNMNQP